MFQSHFEELAFTRQVLWALGYRSESAMDVGAIMAMERMGHELIAPLVFVLDNRIWGEADGALRPAL